MPNLRHLLRRSCLILGLMLWPHLVSAQEIAPLPPPAHSAEVADLSWGVFCALQAMDRQPAPGTLSGWMHVPRDAVAFHWPDTRILPAELGLAFGVRAQLVPGRIIPDAEIRVFRPGRSTTEIWHSTLTDSDQGLAFFRFDTADEQISGIWTFEAWAEGTRLYQVVFEVVPAGSLAKISGACGAVS